MLIPAGHRSSQTYLDSREDVIKADTNVAMCEFPSFIAIPQHATHIDTSFTQKMVRYQLTPIGTKPFSQQHHEILYAKDRKGVSQAAIFQAIRVDCSNPQQRTKQSMYGLQMRPCAIFDTSASMGSMTLEAQFSRVAKILQPNITTLVHNTQQELKDMRLHDKSTVTMDDVPKSLELYVGNNISGQQKLSLPFPATFLDPKTTEDQRQQALQDAFHAAFREHRERGTALYVGGNVAIAQQDATLQQCKREGYAYLSDSHSLAITLPHSLLVYTSREKIPQFERLPHHGHADALAEREQLPVFLTLALFDGTIGKTPAVEEQAKQAAQHVTTPQDWIAAHTDAVAAFHTAPSLLQTPAADRKELYDVFTHIIANNRRDEHVRNRLSALLAAWSLRGDTKAADALWKGYTQLNTVTPLSVQAYTAKCLSLTSNAQQQTTLLQHIRSNPTAVDSATHLIALAGSPRFLEALRAIVSQGWGMKLIENQRGATLLEALSVIFQEPMLLFRSKQQRSDETIRTLAGVPWTMGQLEQTFQQLSAYAIPSLKDVLGKVTPHLTRYALATQRPPWTKAAQIISNPLPRSRLFYESSPAELEQQLQLLAKRAHSEEAWISFEHRNHALLFESGLLATSNSVVDFADWPFYEKHMAGSTVESSVAEHTDTPLLIVHRHLHPWNDLSAPQAFSAIPSTTDFSSGWVGFLYRARKRFPQARYAFHIHAPVGTTRVTPTDTLLEAIDSAIASKSRPRLPQKALRALQKYARYIHGRKQYILGNDLQDILADYWQVDFPRAVRMER